MREHSAMKITPLQPGTSLELIHDEKILFSSSGKWLYPLFELEEFIEMKGLVPEKLLLHDHIAGRAAASIITRAGFRKCVIDIISRPALEIFEKYGVHCDYNELVDLIQCRTEHLITAEMQLDEVYFMLKKRAGLSTGVELDITDLTVKYGLKTVIDNLNLTMKPGERLVITGDNGAGKSTLLKAIIGAVKLSSGNISIGNRENNSSVKPLTGYISQSNSHTGFATTAWEVVSSGLAGQKIKSSDADYRIEISMRRTGSFQLRKRNFQTLSGGEKQRVSLARCLCQRAGLLLMDEPTSFLDADSKNDLIDVLAMIRNSHAPTIMLVSHDHEWIERLGWAVRELEGGSL